MVDILGDLLGFSVFLEKSSKDSLSSHPQDLSGILAFLVPLLLPIPLCLPFLLASWTLLHLDLECIPTCLFMIKPSLNNFLMFFLEFARATSLVSFGSIQTRFFPHFNTVAASLPM